MPNKLFDRPLPRKFLILRNTPDIQKDLWNSGIAIIWKKWMNSREMNEKECKKWRRISVGFWIDFKCLKLDVKGADLKFSYIGKLSLISQNIARAEQWAKYDLYYDAWKFTYFKLRSFRGDRDRERIERITRIHVRCMVPRYTRLLIIKGER